MYRQIALVAALIGTVVVCSGCAGDGPAATSGGGSSFDVVQREVFQKNCVDGPCHTSASQAGGLILESGYSFSQLVNVTPINQAAANAGLLRVEPNNPNGSLLMLKLLGNTYPSRMPEGKSPLSESEIQLVRHWILDGAPGPGAPEFTATASPTSTLTPIPSMTPTVTATTTLTATSTISPTSTVSPTGTQQPTSTRTITATVTTTPSATPSPSATSKPTILPGSTFAEIQANIFNPTCLNEGCHNSVDQAGLQVLEADVSYSQLFGVAPTSAAAVSAGMLRVKPGNPDKSFLFKKISLPTVFDLTFGSRMPQVGSPLTAEQIGQVRAWILRGALRDE